MRYLWYAAVVVGVLALGLYAATTPGWFLYNWTHTPPATGCINPAGEPGDPAIIDGEGAVCRKMGDGKYGWLLIAPPTAAKPEPETSAPVTTTTKTEAYFNACTSEGLSPDITALKNNGQVVPNSWVFLDKNESEVAAGDYWLIDVPANVYGHIFYPVSGLTYQVRGPAKLMVGTATFWCDNGGSTPHDGQYQMVDAKKLADMLLDKNWELAGDGAIGRWVNVPSIENQPK